MGNRKRTGRGRPLVPQFPVSYFLFPAISAATKAPGVSVAFVAAGVVGLGAYEWGKLINAGRAASLELLNPNGDLFFCENSKVVGNVGWALHPMGVKRASQSGHRLQQRQRFRGEQRQEERHQRRDERTQARDKNQAYDETMIPLHQR